MAPHLLIAASLLASMLIAPAQESAPENGALEEIIVTATRLPAPAERLPFAVATVGREEIQAARQQLGLDEALAGVPGLFFQNRYNFAQDLRIAIRGFGVQANFGIRGIRLIADDIPLTLPDGQGSVDAVNLGSAESIEVLRGPFSAVYGASSGGVILIRSEEGPDEPFLSARFNGGNYDFYQGQLKSGGRAGSFNWMANLSTTRLDGYRHHSKLESDLLNARLRHDFDESTRLTVVINAVDSPQADDPGGLTAAEVAADRRQAAPQNLLFDAGESVEQQSLGAALRRQIDLQSEMLVRTYYVHRDFTNRLPFGINANGQGGSVELQRDFYGLGGNWSREFELAGRQSRFVAGIDYDAQRDRRRRFANLEGVKGQLTTDQDEDVTALGVYLQDEVALSDALALTLGARYDELEYDIFDHTGQGGSGRIDFTEFSPMAGLSWAARSGLHFYGNISRSFDPPATTELANPEGPTGFNQSLDSQKATNYEIGIKGRADSPLRYELALFHIDVDDAIVPFELEGSGQSFFQNAGAATHDGLEAALAVELANDLTASLSYTYSDFTFDRFSGTGGETFDGNRIPGIPEHLIQAGLRWESNARLHIALDVLHASSFFADNANQVRAGDYTVADARIGYRWSGAAWEVAPFAGIHNLFGERYEANVRINAGFGRYFEPAPGRNAYAGIELRRAMVP